MIERQELYCHECGHYVQFPIDLELNGNHVLACPVCGHEHCRVVKDGKITGERWDSRNGAIYQIAQPAITYTSSSTSTNLYTFGSMGSSSLGNIYVAATS